MKTIFRFVLITIVSVLSAHVAMATHIVGGNITYKCLGHGMYEFSLTIRRDCEFGQEPFDKDLHLTIYNGEGNFLVQLGQNGYVAMKFLGVTPVDSDLDGGCISQGNPVCVEEAKYTGTVFLPGGEASGYILAYQRCCRNWTLNNIVDPLLTGTTYFAHILPESEGLCNSSPEFNAWAPIYICSGLPLRFDHAAKDADGDRLEYSLCAPFQGLTFARPQSLKADPPPYEPVVWKAPYSLTDIMGGDPLTIDANTGFMTAVPSTIGQYLVGVCVKEYRNGQLIGITYRDFEFNVRACGEKPVADFEVSSDPCDGLTQSFKNTSTNAKKYQWFFDADGDRTKTSTEENPTFTFDSAGTYKVLLKVDNDGCTDSVFHILKVLHPDIKVDFEYELLCEDSVALVLTSKATGNDSLVGWEWKVVDPKGTYTASGKSATVRLIKGAKVKVTLEVTDVNGCKASLEKSLYLPNIDIEWAGDSLEICQGDSVALLQSSRPFYHYKWSPTEGLNLSDPGHPIASPDESTTYHVTITNDTCSLVDSVYVEVHDTIPVVITGTDTTCDGQVVLVAHSPGTTTFEWAYNDGFTDVISRDDTLKITVDTDTTIYVRAGEEEECQGVSSRRIVYGGRNVHIPGEQIICYGSGEVDLNPGGDTSLTYQWRPGVFLDDSTSANPRAKLNHSQTFHVTVTDPSFPQCEMELDVEVKVGPKFTISNLPVDTILCDMDTLTLDVKVSPDGGSLSWCDASGNTIGTGNPIRFSPKDSANYILKVTDSLGCVTRDTVFIRSYHPDFEVVYAKDVCSGDSVVLEVVNHGEPIHVTWRISEQVELIDPKIIVRPTKAAHTYHVRVTYGDGCVYEEDIDINVHGFDDGEVVATADPRRVVVGRTVQLDVEPGGYSYQWTPTDVLDDPSKKSPVATLNETGDVVFKVKVTDEYRCMAMDTVLVHVLPLDCEKGVFLPNAFSPNGDGVNDELRVRGYVIKDMNLSIYDRWGEKVFESTDQSEGWDGRFKGRGLTSDVYNFILRYTCINDEQFSRTGNVSIILR